MVNTFVSKESEPLRLALARLYFLPSLQSGIDFLDRYQRRRPFAGFDAIECFDSDPSPAREFSLSPTNPFAIAHNVARHDCSHGRYSRFARKMFGWIFHFY